MIEPHLPKNRPGARRVGDRRVISGILHVLRLGCCWSDCPPEYGPSTTIYNRYNCWSVQGVWRRLFECLAAAGNIPDEISIDRTPLKARSSAAAAQGRPIAFVLTQATSRISPSPPPLEGIAPPRHLLANKSYDAGHPRQPLEAQGGEVVIPSNGTRRNHPLNRHAYRRRNVIERMFGRMKDWRRVATRYDRLARNFPSAIALVATVCFWIN